MAEKWIEVNELLNILLTKTKFKTSMLKSDSCDYSDAYIIVKGMITVEGVNDAEKEIKN